MPTLVVVVTGVGGAAGAGAAEAITFLLAGSSLFAEVIFASAAVRFLVVGGMVAAGEIKAGVDTRQRSTRWPVSTDPGHCGQLYSIKCGCRRWGVGYRC